MFTLCSTRESVVQAVQVLAAADYVILDCEGRDLGTSSGALSLISLGTPDAAQVYLFDVLALPHGALQLLFNSVFSLTPSARGKTKIVWDGRMDYVELYHTYSCPIENVLDLQLADVLSREKRRERDSRRLCRFARRDFPLTEIRKLHLEEVHALNSMNGALIEHRIKRIELKNRSVQRLHLDNLSDAWMERPLSHELLAYAAGDIYRIAKLFEHFLRRGYLEQIQPLLDLSSLYVSMHRQTGKPDRSNRFLTGPCLPLSISLKPNPVRSEHALEKGKVCSGCRRFILERHFPFEPESASTQEEQDTTREVESAPRSTMCKVCTLILAKLSFGQKLEEEKCKAKTEYKLVRSDADNNANVIKGT